MLPFNGVAVPFGPPVGDGLMPPGGVDAPKAVAPGFGEAIGDGPALSSLIGASAAHPSRRNNTDFFSGRDWRRIGIRGDKIRLRAEKLEAMFFQPVEFYRGKLIGRSRSR
jgi:hypothetical protein